MEETSLDNPFLPLALSAVATSALNDFDMQEGLHLQRTNRFRDLEHEGVGVLSISQNFTEVSLYQKGVEVFQHRVPFGTGTIYVAVQIRANTSRQRASWLIRKYGVCLEEYFAEEREDWMLSRAQKLKRLRRRMERGILTEIIQKRLEDIFTYSFCTVKNAGFEKRIPGGFILKGDLTGLAGIAKLAEICIGVSCRIA